MDEKDCWEHFRWVMTMAAMLSVPLRLLVGTTEVAFCETSCSGCRRFFQRRRFSHIQAASKGVVLDPISADNLNVRVWYS